MAELPLKCLEGSTTFFMIKNFVKICVNTVENIFVQSWESQKRYYQITRVTIKPNLGPKIAYIQVVCFSHFPSAFFPPEISRQHFSLFPFPIGKCPILLGLGVNKAQGIEISASFFQNKETRISMRNCMTRQVDLPSLAFPTFPCLTLPPFVHIWYMYKVRYFLHKQSICISRQNEQILCLEARKVSIFQPQDWKTEFSDLRTMNFFIAEVSRVR